MSNFKYIKYVRNDVVKSSEFVTSPKIFTDNFKGVNFTSSPYIKMSYAGKLRDIPGLCGIRSVDYTLNYLSKKIGFEEVFYECSKSNELNGNISVYEGIGEKTIMEVLVKLGNLEVSEVQIQNENEFNNIFKQSGNILVANVTELDNETNEFGSHWVTVVDVDIQTKEILVADPSFRKEKSGGLLIYSWNDFNKIFRDLESGEFNKEETEVLPISNWYFGYGIKVNKKK
ncbi:MAG: hypothetical protein WCK31_00995 [bacterium]